MPTDTDPKVRDDQRFMVLVSSALDVYRPAGVAIILRTFVNAAGTDFDFDAAEARIEQLRDGVMG